MKITKKVEVTIEVRSESEGKMCSTCCLFLGGIKRPYCFRYKVEVRDYNRCPQCIAEFGEVKV